ncbi:hypothetical protein [Streptosporangium sp. NPDC023615]|uniref:hypothetical protein n=1 Tax=Streptosporangium sp. NPDC023615 TaxID=3154794 RepID=UPI003412A81C
MRNSEKTPQGYRRLAEKSRETGQHAVAAELELLAQEAEQEIERKAAQQGAKQSSTTKRKQK